MGLLRPTWKSRPFKFVTLRRVEGLSMSPTLRPGQVIWGSGVFGALQTGDMVIIRHEGMEKVKRLEAVEGNRIYVRGDNASYSTDSRHFGWLPASTVQAKVVWPRATQPLRLPGAATARL